jgi:hypothetical protein
VTLAVRFAVADSTIHVNRDEGVTALFQAAEACGTLLRPFRHG